MSRYASNTFPLTPSYLYDVVEFYVIAIYIAIYSNQEYNAEMFSLFANKVPIC